MNPLAILIVWRMRTQTAFLKKDLRCVELLASATTRLKAHSTSKATVMEWLNKTKTSKHLRRLPTP